MARATSPPPPAFGVRLQSAAMAALAAGALAGCARYHGGGPQAPAQVWPAPRLAFASDVGERGAKHATPRGGPAVQVPDHAIDTPAHRYGNLDRASCEAELARRAIPFVRVDDARGVLAPVRLTGSVSGVAFHSALPARQWATSSIEVFDCRLVLALSDFAAILRSHDVVEVVHMSAWRPPARRWPDGKIGGQHEGALALDAGTFVRAHGTPLVVEKDFHGRIGARTCGPSAGPSPATPEALELRLIACQAADAHLFQVELTPDFNWPHRNHFHLEVRPDTTWFLLR